MLIMLFHFGACPSRCSVWPQPGKPGDIIMEIYEGDIRKWIASIADSEKRNVAAQTFLKSCIETRNPVFNKLIEDGACGHPLHRARPAFRPHRFREIHLARKIYELRYNKGLVPGSFRRSELRDPTGRKRAFNLFGHVRGSFTGATAVRQGLLKTAHEGISSLTKSWVTFRSRYR